MFEKIKPLLQQITEDRTVPRNIKEKIKECVLELDNDKDATAVKVNTIVSCLDEISNDTNLPMYTRTQIWNIVSALEEEGKEAEE